MTMYRANATERLEVGTIVHWSPDTVAAWLRNSWKPPDKWELYQYSPSLRPVLGVATGYEQNRGVLEYLACRRRHPLIDHALARYGYSIPVIQRVFDRGGASARFAALANPRGGWRLHSASDIVRFSSVTMVQAILQNPSIDGSIIEAIFQRRDIFADLSDQRLLWAMHFMASNPRMAQAYDGPMDGWAEHSHNHVFQVAWGLARTLPATRSWAYALERLLAKCHKPISFPDLEATIARWRIEVTSDEKRFRWLDPSFAVRVLLGGLVRDDAQLLNSDDLALRIAFYRRFSPERYRDWPSWLSIDGQRFVEAALENPDLWQNSERRDRLRQVCWDCPDPQSHMDMPNAYEATESRFRSQCPGWFAEEPEVNPIMSVLEEIRDELRAISDRVDAIERR